MATRLSVFSVAGGPPGTLAPVTPDDEQQRHRQRAMATLREVHQISPVLLARVEQGLAAGEPPAQLIARLKQAIEQQEQRRQALATPPPPWPPNPNRPPMQHSASTPTAGLHQKPHPQRPQP